MQIEDAMRRDTAAPSFWGPASRVLSGWAVFADFLLSDPVVNLV